MGALKDLATHHTITAQIHLCPAGRPSLRQSMRGREPPDSRWLHRQASGEDTLFLTSPLGQRVRLCEGAGGSPGTDRMRSGRERGLAPTPPHPTHQLSTWPAARRVSVVR